MRGYFRWRDVVACLIVAGSIAMICLGHEHPASELLGGVASYYFAESWSMRRKKG